MTEGTKSSHILMNPKMRYVRTENSFFSIRAKLNIFDPITFYLFILEGGG